MWRNILLAADLVLLSAGILFAQDEEKPEEQPKEAPKAQVAAPALEHVIYVPYKELSKVFEKEGRGVFIPYREFRKIWEKATTEKVKKPLPPVPAVVTKASYKLEVKNDVAKGKGVLSVEVLTEDWISLPLNLNRLALQEVKLDGGRALLMATSRSYTLVLRGKGEHTLEFSFAVPLDKSGGGGKFAFGCPAAPVSELSVEIPQTDIEVDVQPKLVATVKQGKESTTVLAFVGNTGTVSVSWKPKPREALPLAGVFFAKVVNRHHVGDRVLNMTSEIDYEILQELNQLMVNVPSGMRLLGVEGKQIKSWNVEEDEQGASLLTVNLLTQVKKNYRLKLTLERDIKGGKQIIELPRVNVPGATRETGFVSLTLGAYLWAKLAESKGVSQVSAREMPAGGHRAPEMAFRYLAHPYTVKVQIGEVKPEIKVENYTRFTITKEFLDLASHLVVDIKKRPVFSLSLEIPEGYAVIEVPVRLVKDYRVKKVEKKRVLELDFVKPMVGRVALQIYLQKKRDKEGTVDLPATRVVEAEKQTGVFGVYLASQLKVETLEKSGLIPVDASAFAPAQGSLRQEPNTVFAMAFRYHKLPVSAKLKVESRKTRIDATVETLVSVREEIVKVHSTVRYKVLYAPVRAFSLTLPKSPGEDARVRGPNTSSVTKKTQGETTTWIVQLQGNVIGDYALTVDYDMKAKFDTSTVRELAIAELTLKDVFQETGFIGIKKTESLRVSPKATEGLEVVDVQELPEVLRSRLPYEAYKYVLHPYKLALSVQKQELGRVLDTIINLMHLETEISRDGDATNKCLWRIQSKNRQFISFVLPENAEVMKLYIDGKDTRRTTSAKGPNYLVVNLSAGFARSSTAPLSKEQESSRPGEQPQGGEEVTVEVVYKQKLLDEDSSMGLTGSFSLEAPVPEEDIPILRLTWSLYVPRGYMYAGFGGNLRRLFKRESVWIWGKSLIFGTRKDTDGDVALKEEIDTVRKLFVSDPKLIKFKFSGDSEVYNFVKHEGEGKIRFTYFERNFFFALDVLVLIATVAGMLAAASYVPHLTKMRLGVVVIAVSLVLRTLTSGAGGEFLATVFLGAVLVCAYWIVRFFALPPARRLAAAGVGYGGSTAPLSKEQESRRPGEQETGEQPPSATEGGGDDA